MFDRRHNAHLIVGPADGFQPRKGAQPRGAPIGGNGKARADHPAAGKAHIDAACIARKTFRPIGRDLMKRVRRALRRLLRGDADMPVLGHGHERTGIIVSRIEMQKERRSAPAHFAIRHHDVGDRLKLAFKMRQHAELAEHGKAGRGERGNAPVEFRPRHVFRRLRIDHRHLEPSLREAERQRQADKTAAHDGDIEHLGIFSALRCAHGSKITRSGAHVQQKRGGLPPLQPFAALALAMGRRL